MKLIKSFCVLFLCSCMAMSADIKKKAEVIAHRGYWQCEGSAPNSLRSLELAQKIGVYGSEFDVHLTSDDVAVVFHDDTIQGKPIQHTTYAELKDLKLPNGERLPTLEQYLARARTLEGMQLIFELKAHASPERDRKAAAQVVEWIKQMDLQGRTDYITFSLEAGKELIRLAPEADVYYLGGNLCPRELKALGFTGLDYSYEAMQEHPEWFADAQRVGLKVNIWTVDDPKKVEKLLDRGVDFITTNYPEEMQKLITILTE